MTTRPTEITRAPQKPALHLAKQEAEKLLLTLVLLPVVVIGALLTAIVTAAVEHYLRHHPIKTP